jgi:hypothetical protein
MNVRIVKELMKRRRRIQVRVRILEVFKGSGIFFIHGADGGSLWTTALSPAKTSSNNRLRNLSTTCCPFGYKQNVEISIQHKSVIK